MVSVTPESPGAPAAPTALPTDWTLADLLAHLGGISAQRIRAYPPLGTATEEDVLRSKSRWNCICELVDGVLVEKTAAYFESFLAVEISYLLSAFLKQNDLGIVLGEAGTLKILPNQVRIPDISFIRWEKFPGRQLPREPIPALAPDLAIEVLSPGNTEGEMQRKLRDYFTAGVRLVWYIDPRTRSAKAYTAVDRCEDLGEDGILSGGEVLAGFELPLRELFAKVAQRPA